MRLVGFFLTLVLFFFQSESRDIFNAKSFKLNNGLRLIVVENNRAPVIAQMIWYNFGSSVEEKGKSGLAHFMEHLMFKGTKRFPGDYFSNYISRIGGNENAFTSYDYTAYYQVFPSKHIEKIMELEADRMKNLTLTRKNIRTEREVILEERFQRIESNPSSQLDESMRSILYPNNYYGRPIIGWKHEIENLTFEDVIEFYQDFYCPNNAIIVLSGDIKFSKAKELVKKFYGNIKKSPDKNIVDLEDPELRTLTNVELKDSNVKQQIWKKIYRVKSYKQSIIESIALDLGMKILAGGTSSVLYDEFVNRKKIFSMVGGAYQGLVKGDGYIYFYAIPNEEMNEKEIDKIINFEMISAIEKRITEEKLDIEKKKYFFDSVYRGDGILKPAEIIGEALTVGLKLQDIEKWNNKLDDISLEMVKKELRKLSKNKNFVIGSLKN
ncbi:MAG: pitrilysin family protein [Pseudomonadota bacterium]|nr:pitrilysin family protein [Pseudomonadota bacterium]